MLTYEALLRELFERSRKGMRPGIVSTRQALQRLGNPHRSYRVVHVAGTNGKGSTSALTEAALRASGCRTGLYNSPHLSRFTERIRVHGIEIEPEIAAQIGERVLEVAPDATFFETATLIAFEHFRRSEVEIAVIETGLGGRLDATNVVDSDVCVLTRIDHDHRDVLGTELTSIAREKAGILKHGALWLSAPQCDEVRSVLPPQVSYVEKPWEGELSLDGPHQRENAALAAAAAQHFGVSMPLLEQSFAHTHWPGRLERVGDFLLDCAHNPDAARKVVASLTDPLPVVFGCLRDKDAVRMLEVLQPVARSWTFVAPRSDRARDPRQLAELVSEAQVQRSLAEALHSLSGTIALVTGSSYLVGEARELLLGEKADPIAVGDPVRLNACPPAANP